jgi:Fe2+ or Zn2+ uptake regulation protein
LIYDPLLTLFFVKHNIMKKRLKIRSNQAIYNLLDKFVEQGILEEIGGKKRNRTYVFDKMMNILK